MTVDCRLEAASSTPGPVTEQGSRRAFFNAGPPAPRLTAQHPRRETVLRCVRKAVRRHPPGYGTASDEQMTDD